MDVDGGQGVTMEAFQALQEQMRDLQKKLKQREKGEWVAEDTLTEVPNDPTKAVLEASERKKLLKPYPEDTRMVWQGASLDKEQRARMGKEARNHEATLFDIQGDILEALRPLLDVVDINFNTERRERLLQEEKILEEITVASTTAFKLLAGTASNIEIQRRELALSAINPRLAGLARPAAPNPLITRDDHERMEAFQKEEAMKKKLGGEPSQPFRGSGQRGGNTGRGNFPQAWRPYAGGGQAYRGRGRGMGAPQHQQHQHQQAPQQN